ncbi:MAG TPA: hypothetical protein VKU41_00155 [Polyangiaceae bacterium]|nr:hypothetical protein [Polyangiaceae bacterium]
MSRKGRRGRGKDGGSSTSSGRGHHRQPGGATITAEDRTDAQPPAASAISGSSPDSDAAPRRVADSPAADLAEPTPVAFASPAQAAHGEPSAGGPNAAPERAEAEDASVPPVGDIDAHFFRSSRPPPHSHDPSLDADDRDPRAALRMTKRAVERRAYLARYVTGAVAVAAALCVIALLKSAFGHADDRPAGPPTSAHGSESKPLGAETAAVDPGPAFPAPVETVERTVAEAPAAKDPEPPASNPPGAAGPTSAAAPSPGVPAAQEVDPPAVAPDPGAKPEARAALEHGRLGAAIEAGERSVAADPGDCEAWLILGAAYQQKGDWKDARRCYKSCVDEGVRGPKDECAAMLR